MAEIATEPSWKTSTVPASVPTAAMSEDRGTSARSPSVMTALCMMCNGFLFV